MSASEKQPNELHVEQALADYMSQCDSGELPDRETFLAEHPELREKLSELLDTADWIERLAGPTISDVSFSGQLPGEGGEAASAEAPEEETLVHGISIGADEATLPGISVEAAVPSTEDALTKNPNENRLSQPILPCRFGEYVLERVIGRGGMGIVYHGHQINLERPVAIKMIRSGALASDEEVQRFYAEARSAAKLDHSGIVTVYQCGEQDGHHYFSMDFIPGTDLEKIIRDGPVDKKQAAAYVRDAAIAIQYAHNRGVVHRDLKPANILIDEQGKVRVTDFGLAKLMGHETGLTASGAALGTPSYMSPEQAAGRIDEQNQATDVYALGAILFAAVAGRPPFKAGSVVQTIMHVIHKPAPRVRTVNENVDADLETIIDVCLQKSIERRYDSAADLACDLDRYIAGQPIEARPMPALQRAWYWLLGVPIFGAVLDNRVIEPTDAHRWFQRGMIALALLMLTAWMLVLIPSSVWFRNRMPSTVRVAAGTIGGSYDLIAREICTSIAESTGVKAIPLATAGSTDNLERLLNKRVDLAMLQADAMEAPEIAVVSPLYFEVVHILVRSGSSIETVADFASKRIFVGAEKSGSRQVAEELLRYCDLGIQDIEVCDEGWQDAAEEARPEAMIIVSKLGSGDVRLALGEFGYQLLGLAEAVDFSLDEPSFHVHTVRDSDYPNCGVNRSGVAAVATTAFLAARFDTPDVLVQQTLRSLFDPAIVASTGILSAERAAHWKGIPWHPAAREYFKKQEQANDN